MASSSARPLFSRLPAYAHLTLRYSYYTAVGLSAIVFAHNHVVEVTGVSGKSMAPTLSPRFDEAGDMDRVLFNRIVAPQLLRRGDIVSFWAPHKPEQWSVKRIVGLPGDTVVTKGRYPFRRVIVPHSHVWVEGDNWRHTVDSNDFGPIPMALINGRAEYIVWPFGRIGKVPDPNVEFQTYSKVIPAKAPSRLPREYQE